MGDATDFIAREPPAQSYRTLSLPGNPSYHVLSINDHHSSSNNHGGGHGNPPSCHCEPVHTSAFDINPDPTRSQSYRSLSLPGIPSYHLLSINDDHSSSNNHGGGHGNPPSCRCEPVHTSAFDINPDPTRSQSYRSVSLPGIPSYYLLSTNGHHSSNNHGGGNVNPPSFPHCQSIHATASNINPDPANSKSYHSPSLSGNPSYQVLSTNDDHSSNNHGGGHGNPSSSSHCEPVHTSAASDIDPDPDSDSEPKKRISVPMMWSRMLVPKALYQVRPQVYSPQFLAIGPLSDRSCRHAFLMKKCKGRCLDRFLAECKVPFDLDSLTADLFYEGQKTKGKGKATSESEGRKPKSKAKSSNFNMESLEWHIVLDSVYVLDFVLYFYAKDSNVWSEYFSTVTLGHIQRDLFMLQNQVPLTFLVSLTRYQDLEEKKLFSAIRRMIWDFSPFTSPDNDDPNFEDPELKEMLSDTSLSKGKYEHLLHCLYQACIMKPKKEEDKSQISTSTNAKKLYLKPKDRIPRASELCKVGVKFEAVDGTATAIGYDTKNLIVKLPKLVVDDGTECKLRNLVAYELTSQRNNELDICTYVMLMDSLIDKTDDLDILYKFEVLQNHLGSDEKLIAMWNEMRANIQLPTTEKQKKLTLDIITPYRTCWRKIYVEFQRRFFSRPWYTLSALAALLLLLMTALQTIYSVMGAYKA